MLLKSSTGVHYVSNLTLVLRLKIKIKSSAKIVFEQLWLLNIYHSIKAHEKQLNKKENLIEIGYSLDITYFCHIY